MRKNYTWEIEMATVDRNYSEHDEMLYIREQETNTGSFNTAKMENEEVSVQPTTNIPDLPTGKQHHVFISYAEVDQAIAYKLIERLENVGYKICHHNKDFTPGWLITDNIKHCVMGSMKTIVILSNGAIASPWCSYETEITLYMSLEMRKKILIPLAIENCTIPDHLKTLTRIDYYNEKVDWWAKLLDAINAADEVPTFHSDVPAISSIAFGYNPYYSNLDNLVEIPSKTSNIFSQKLNKQYVPEELSRRGIQITQQEYEEIKDYINRHLFPRDGYCLYNKRFALWLHLIIFIVFFIPSVVMLYIAFTGGCSKSGHYDVTNEDDECDFYGFLLLVPAAAFYGGYLKLYSIRIQIFRLHPISKRKKGFNGMITLTQCSEDNNVFHFMI